MNAITANDGRKNGGSKIEQVLADPKVKNELLSVSTVENFRAVKQALMASPDPVAEFRRRANNAIGEVEAKMMVDRIIAATDAEFRASRDAYAQPTFASGTGGRLELTSAETKELVAGRKLFANILMLLGGIGVMVLGHALPGVAHAVGGALIHEAIHDMF